MGWHRLQCHVDAGFTRPTAADDGGHAVRRLDGEWIYSPSDLTGFAACEHLTQLERRAALDEITRPNREDPLLEVISRLGDEHEERVLAEHDAAAHGVVKISVDSRSRAGLERAAAETIEAMHAGAGLVYQATFLHDEWVGHADFLERVDAPSALGAWSYEVADAKLARSVKPGALLQVCAYSEQVEHIQGAVPAQVHVLTGDDERHSFRLADLAAYYRALKQRFLDAVRDSTLADTYPERVEHCSICRWLPVCAAKRRADDHLSLVAGMRRDQARKLAAAGVPTMHALATSAAAAVDIGAPVLERLHSQAALQVKGAGEPRPLHELLPPDEHDAGGQPRGLAALPEPSPGDLFLDLEGDPYAAGGGLEYLFGVVEVVDDKPVYHPFWGHDRAEEKRAFEQLVDFVTDRRRRHPDLHVYHYASYEPTRIGRLMGMHGTREVEVDDLLRGKVFVDLFRILRDSVRLSTESYSLKSVEGLYMDRAGDAVLDAGASIVWYERYLTDRDPALLDELATYNEADCVSLVHLRRWLEDRRVEAEPRFGPIPRAAPEAAPESEDLRRWEEEIQDLADRLTHDVPDAPAERDDEQQARWLLAQLLWWHRREDKPAWWKYFERVERATEEELVDDRECIGGLRHVGAVRDEDRSTVHRYEFDAQDHKFAVGNTPHDPATNVGAGTIVAIGDDFVELKRGDRTAARGHPRALIPSGPFPIAVLREAVRAVAEWVLENDIDAPGPFRAARELLQCRPPRNTGTPLGAALLRDAEQPLDAACRMVTELDGTCLPIQGPPGSGKTYTGAHMICTLLRAGRRVGVTAHTHAAITNLLNEVCDVGDGHGVELRGLQKVDGGRGCADDRIECTNNNDAVEVSLAAGEVNLAAGTAWLWSRDGMRNAVDVLFIDEAGQMSLANVIAVAGATRSIVLLGDPQQLAHPSQGSHPPGAGVSALQHVLGTHETIPADRGLFLDATYRMHPSVCAFISEIAYESRLHSAPGMELQAVDGFAGLRFVPVEHDGNRVRSPEEAAAVGDLAGQLVGKTLTNERGEQRELSLNDVIIVAPYNAHVAELRRVLPDARIGTVDKFQGQQGFAAIYSMASSSVEDAPRDMSFLYDLHRLNVAVSRARAAGVVVCSPELLRVLCRTPEQIKLANALCRYEEVAVR
jgi:predicted RecB family nuclease